MRILSFVTCLTVISGAAASGGALYDTLEISSDASSAEIKKAYRRLALRFHPDKNDASDAAERFRAVTEAYETLGTASERALYDRDPHGYDAAAGGGGGGGGGAGAMRRRGGGGGGGGDPFATFRGAFGDVWSGWEPGMTVTGSFRRGARRHTITIHPDGSSDETVDEAGIDVPGGGGNGLHGGGSGGSYSKISRTDKHGRQSVTVQVEGWSGLVEALLPSFVPPVVASVLVLTLCNGYVCCGLFVWLCCFGVPRSAPIKAD
jgi:hypothetical protein